MGDSSLTCCKYLMFFFNLLIFLGGSALLGVGIWVAVGANSFKQVISSDPTIFSAVYLIIAVGCLLFIVGFLGCCGAIKENKCMLGTFFVIVLLIFIMEIVGGILAFVYYPKAKEVALQSMKDYGQTTPLGKSVTAAWDELQTNLKCCGLDSPGDWLKPTVLLSLTTYPSSCGDPITAANRPGCAKAIQPFFWALGGIAIAVLVIELLAMIFACCLYRGNGDGKYA